MHIRLENIQNNHYLWNPFNVNMMTFKFWFMLSASKDAKGYTNGHVFMFSRQC